MDESTYKEMYTELETYERHGVSMILDGFPASPMQIIKAHMVHEETTYMRDYVWDEQGRMRAIGFHNVIID